MAKWRVTLSDKRTIDVFAPDEEGAKNQADHAERTRFIIAVKRGTDPGPNPAFGASVEFLKA